MSFLSVHGYSFCSQYAAAQAEATRTQYFWTPIAAYGVAYATLAALGASFAFTIARNRLEQLDVIKNTVASAIGFPTIGYAIVEMKALYRERVALTECELAESFSSYQAYQEHIAKKEESPKS